MTTRTHKPRIKRVALAILLFCIVQWSLGGTIICIDAERHGAVGHCAAEKRCKKHAQIVAPYAAVYCAFEHCIDISVCARKYTPRIRPGLSRYKDALAVRLEADSGHANSSFSMWRTQTVLCPPSLLLASLSTVVLRM